MTYLLVVIMKKGKQSVKSKYLSVLKEVIINWACVIAFHIKTAVQGI